MACWWLLDLSVYHEVRVSIPKVFPLRLGILWEAATMQKVSQSVTMLQENPSHLERQKPHEGF